MAHIVPDRGKGRKQGRRRLCTVALSRRLRRVPWRLPDRRRDATGLGRSRVLTWARVAVSVIAAGIGWGTGAEAAPAPAGDTRQAQAARPRDSLVHVPALVQMARRKIGPRDPGAEIARLRNVVQGDPCDDEAWERLAWGHLALKEPEAAEQAIAAALRVRPFHARHMIARAYCRLALGKAHGTGLILARAQQSNSIPFNHMRPNEVRGVLNRIQDVAVRRAVEAEMRQALATNTFARGKSRTEILKAAGQYGQVAWTRRQPDNKNRLWIPLRGRFLVVFDEEKDAFEDHAQQVAALGMEHSSVSGLAFAVGHVVALTEKGLVSFDRSDGRWRRIETPAGEVNARVASIARQDNRTVAVRLEHGEKARPAASYLYEPSANRWTRAASDEQFLDRLAENEAARAFCVSRYCGNRQPTAHEAACALSQHKDLAAYCALHAPNRTPVEMVDEKGRLRREALEQIVRRQGPAGKLRPYIKGVTFPAWWSQSLDMPESRASLAGVPGVSAEWVSITPTGYQHDPLSVEIGADPEKTISMRCLEGAIERAHGLGLKVLLKPHLNMLIEEKDDHMWRGMIRPRTEADLDAWFRSYQAFLMPYVDLAIRQNVEMMTVGLELKQMVGYRARWLKLIEAVRQRGFNGKLTYAALHETYARVSFWDALDYIGIDAYFPATRNPRADLTAITGGYQALAARLGRFAAAKGKPIVFTEVGFNNLDGCNVRPWFWSGNAAAVDNLEQAACYHAVLEVFPRQEWFAGMFWWTWSPSGPPLPSQPSYSPQSKLAELILEAYYSGGSSARQP